MKKIVDFYKSFLQDTCRRRGVVAEQMEVPSSVVRMRESMKRNESVIMNVR